MKKEIGYYVIGGQYMYVCYGGTPTLLGAKRLATKREEYWDNLQGWHKPKIYRAEDTTLVPNTDSFLKGDMIRIPKLGAIPVE